jgi:ribosomal silencing factor RsfS
LKRKQNLKAKEFALSAARLAAERHCTGYEQARWILLDFIDVVVHIFDAEYRDYYDLELLWGDAKRLSIDE